METADALGQAELGLLGRWLWRLEARAEGPADWRGARKVEEKLRSLRAARHQRDITHPVPPAAATRKEREWYATIEPIYRRRFLLLSQSPPPTAEYLRQNEAITIERLEHLLRFFTRNELGELKRKTGQELPTTPEELAEWKRQIHEEHTRTRIRQGIAS